MADPDRPAYGTRLLSPETWDDFARLVEANNGVWGGCWCMGFHVEGLRADRGAAGNKALKQEHVRAGELPNIKNPGAYAKELVELPSWRIGCVFTDKRHRGEGVARAAVTAVLDEIRAAGGGIVEAYPEQLDDRPPQRGAYLHTGPETLFEEFGFTRDRKIAKWRWVMRLDLTA